MHIGETELDLIAAVGTGPFETPPWQSFLGLLRHMTGAHFAILNFRRPRRPYQDSITVLSGAVLADLDEIVTSFDPPADPPLIESLTEGRLYDLAELLALNTSREMQIHADRLKAHGATNLRHLRVREPSGVNAWLTVVRGDGADFDRAAEALLTMIARFVRIALQNYIAIERERYGASLTSQAVRGMFGWIALDPAGLIIDHDEQCGRLLAMPNSSTGQAADGWRQAGFRLNVKSMPPCRALPLTPPAARRRSR